MTKQRSIYGYRGKKYKKDVRVMCNLSQRIKEDGIAIGEVRGEAKRETTIILTMYKNGLTEEQIAALTNKDLKDVEVIIAGKAPIFA